MPQLPDPAMEMRVIRLEENYWFQEERLKALDGQLVAQQKLIDGLEREVKFLAGRVKALEAALELSQAPGAAPAEEIPPHYLQKPL